MIGGVAGLLLGQDSCSVPLSVRDDGGKAASTQQIPFVAGYSKDRGVQGFNTTNPFCTVLDLGRGRAPARPERVQRLT